MSLGSLVFEGLFSCVSFMPPLFIHLTGLANTLFLEGLCVFVKRKPMLKTPIAAVLPDSHPLARRKSIDLAELSEERFVSLDQKFFPGRPQLMEELGKRAGFSPDIRFFARGFSELLGLIAGGAGVAVLPADVAQLPHPQVVFLTLRRPRFSLVSSAAWRKADEDEIFLELITLLSRPEADQSK